MLFSFRNWSDNAAVIEITANWIDWCINHLENECWIVSIENRNAVLLKHASSYGCTTALLRPFASFFGNADEHDSLTEIRPPASKNLGPRLSRPHHPQDGGENFGSRRWWWFVSTARFLPRFFEDSFSSSSETKLAVNGPAEYIPSPAPWPCFRKTFDMLFVRKGHQTL